MRLRLHRYVLSHTAATFKPFPLTAAITMQSPPGILIAGHTGRLSDGRLRIQASKLALLLICVFLSFQMASHHPLEYVHRFIYFAPSARSPMVPLSARLSSALLWASHWSDKVWLGAARAQGVYSRARSAMSSRSSSTGQAHTTFTRPEAGRSLHHDLVSNFRVPHARRPILRGSTSTTSISLLGSLLS